MLTITRNALILQKGVKPTDKIYQLLLRNANIKNKEFKVGVEVVDTHLNIKHVSQSKQDVPLKWCLVTAVSPNLGVVDKPDTIDGPSNEKFECLWNDFDSKLETKASGEGVFDRSIIGTTNTRYQTKLSGKVISLKVGFKSQSELDTFFDAVLPV